MEMKDLILGGQQNGKADLPDMSKTCVYFTFLVMPDFPPLNKNGLLNPPKDEPMFDPDFKGYDSVQLPAKVYAVKCVKCEVSVLEGGRLRLCSIHQQLMSLPQVCIMTHKMFTMDDQNYQQAWEIWKSYLHNYPNENGPKLSI
jgi:hypothetical protein